MNGGFTTTWNTNSKLVWVKAPVRCFVPNEVAHLDTNRFRLKPTTMGLISPSKRPPKKAGATSFGQLPARTMFTNAVNALRSSDPPSRQSSRLRMCWGRVGRQDIQLILLGMTEPHYEPRIQQLKDNDYVEM